MPLWGNKRELAPVDTTALDTFARALPGDAESVGPAAGWTDRQTRDLLGRDLPLFTAFLSGPARSSVAGGALRFLLPETDPSLVGWNGRGGWRSDWPSVKPAVVFATDWLGRLFFLHSNVRRKDGEPALGMLDSTTGESVDLDYSFGEFIGKALAEDWRNLLDADRLDAWRDAGNEAPRFDQVVAPKQPLILGGSDEIAEMELSFLVVAVSFGGQIWEQVKHLPPGKKITGVSIE